MTKDLQTLSRFYRMCAMKIAQSNNGRISLAEAEKLAGEKNRNMAYSWMQWAEAKQWFGVGYYADELCYTLVRPYNTGSHVMVVSDINEYFANK